MQAAQSKLLALHSGLRYKSTKKRLPRQRTTPVVPKPPPRAVSPFLEISYEFKLSKMGKKVQDLLPRSGRPDKLRRSPPSCIHADMPSATVFLHAASEFCTT